MNVFKPVGALMVFSWAIVAQAEIINLKLTAIQQASEGVQVRTNVYQSTTAKVRITTKDILNLLAQKYSTSFPEGAQLSIANGSAQVLNTNGAVLLNISTAVLDAGGGDEVYSSLEHDTARGSYVEKGVSFGHFSLNAGLSNSFDLQGLVTYQSSESFSTGRFRSSFTMQAAGEGYVAGKYSVISGTILGKTSTVVGSAGAPASSLDSMMVTVPVVALPGADQGR